MANKSGSDGKPKKVKRLGVATVVKPCLIGASILTVLAVALPTDLAPGR